VTVEFLFPRSNDWMIVWTVQWLEDEVVFTCWTWAAVVVARTARHSACRRSAQFYWRSSTDRGTFRTGMHSPYTAAVLLVVYIVPHACQHSVTRESCYRFALIVCHRSQKIYHEVHKMRSRHSPRLNLTKLIELDSKTRAMRRVHRVSCDLTLTFITISLQKFVSSSFGQNEMPGL